MDTRIVSSITNSRYGESILDVGRKIDESIFYMLEPRK